MYVIQFVVFPIGESATAKFFPDNSGSRCLRSTSRMRSTSLATQGEPALSESVSREEFTRGSSHRRWIKFNHTYECCIHFYNEYIYTSIIRTLSFSKTVVPSLVIRSSLSSPPNFSHSFSPMITYLISYLSMIFCICDISSVV